MRSAFAPCLLAVSLVAGCHRDDGAGAVRQAYDNKADTIDAQAARQPTQTAKDIYQDQADAYREEGKDRQKGLEGGEPSKGQGAKGVAGTAGAAPQ